MRGPPWQHRERNGERKRARQINVLHHMARALSIPWASPALRLGNAQDLTLFVRIAMFEKAARGVVRHPEINGRNVRNASQRHPKQEKYRASQQQKIETVKSRSCHREPDLSSLRRGLQGEDSRANCDSDSALCSHRCGCCCGCFYGCCRGYELQ